MSSSYDDLLICNACGTQFPVHEKDQAKLRNCRICDDPRQFIPPTGQSFTTHAHLATTHYNTLTPLIPTAPLPSHTHIYSVTTSPKFGIGQRCLLLLTPRGNVLWDLIPLLTPPTDGWIRSVGGIDAIVISHPHYYGTHAMWAERFGCPVYLGKGDEGWVEKCEGDGAVERRWVETREEIVVRGAGSGVWAIRTGGHFEGSLVLAWDKRLFHADSFVTVPSGLYHIDRPKGTTSYSFLWSIPNMIPLSPSQIKHMWEALKPFEFTSTYGAFLGTDVEADDVKNRVLESMKIQIKAMGYAEHEMLEETC